MAEFSIQEAAFTGFRVVRERPWVLAIWAAFALVMSVVFTASLVKVAGPDIMRLQQFGALGDRDPAAAMEVLGKLLPLYLLLTPVALVFYGVVYAAMNRAVLCPHDKKLGYLGLGGDELRQIGLMLILALLAIGAYLVFLIVIVLVGLLVQAVAHSGPQSIVLIAVPGFFVVFGFLAVRMSLASALTFQTRRVNVFGSWVLTRGRFWPLFGTYLMTLALSGVVLFLTYLVILAAAAVVTGGNMFALMAAPDMSSTGAYFTAPHLVQLVLGAGVSALIWPIVLTPPAAIYRRLTAGHAEPVRQVLT